MPGTHHWLPCSKCKLLKTGMELAPLRESGKGSRTYVCSKCWDNLQKVGIISADRVKPYNLAHLEVMTLEDGE